MLDLSYLSWLINDHIHHDPSWKYILLKLPSYILKFDGKSSEDPKNHVMTYHLWCSSKSLTDGSIHLILFQRNLTGAATKWYIEFPWHSFQDFNTLERHFWHVFSYQLGWLRLIYLIIYMSGDDDIGWLRLIYLIIYMSGDDNIGWLRLSFLINYLLIGLLSHYLHPFPGMFPCEVLLPKRKPSTMIST